MNAESLTFAQDAFKDISLQMNTCQCQEGRNTQSSRDCLFSSSSKHTANQYNTESSVKSKCSEKGPVVTSLHSRCSNDAEESSKANKFLKECNNHFSSINSKSNADNIDNKSEESILTQKPSNDFKENLDDSKHESEHRCNAAIKHRKSEGNTLSLAEKSNRRDSLSNTDRENDLISLTLSISETVDNKKNDSLIFEQPSFNK